jgi:hypothetical protein
MELDLIVPAFLDEMVKIGQSLGMSQFQQTRSGRRPIRVHNLLRKEKPLEHDKPDDAEERYKPPERGVEYEGGSGMTEGVGNYMGGA